MNCPKCHYTWEISSAAVQAVKFCPACAAPLEVKQPKDFDTLGGALITIRERYGAEIFLDRGKFFNIFRDMAVDLARDKKVFVPLSNAFDVRVPELFLRADGKNEEEKETALKLAFGRLTEDAGMSEPRADMVTEAFAEAFRWAERIRRAATPAAPVPAPTPKPATLFPAPTAKSVTNPLQQTAPAAARRQITLGGKTFWSDDTTLELKSAGISDITALSGMTKIKRLDLYENQIRDIKVLSGLTSLTHLYLSKNQISDITPLSRLTGLCTLYLYSNQITDFKALSGLTGLTTLSMWNNKTSDIQALANLTNLMHLDLYGVSIRDIRALSGLTNLRILDLRSTPISDITPLSSLINLKELRLPSLPQYKIDYLRKCLPKWEIG